MVAVSDHLLELEVAWRRHVSPDRTAMERIVARHREKHRRYHTVAHVGWVMRHVRELADVEPVADLDAVVAAAFYHDAVYEPASPANERASARLARRDLTEFGWPEDRTAAVAAMIEGTEAHLDPPDVDTAVLFDADLAVLAADPAGYGEYVRGVRAEYRHVDDAAWATGRAEVLRSFLDRAAIYATASGRDRWEHRARANITTELSALT